MMSPLQKLAYKKATPKCFYNGTHRLFGPEKTVQKVWLLAPVMGITRIANVTGLDSIGIPVVMVCRPNSRSVAVSQGKGLTLGAAKASGLMESAEAYHAERIMCPLKLASYEELRYTHNVVNVSQLPQPTTGVFHPNLPLLWIEGYDILQSLPTWVPYETVHLNHTVPLPPGTGCFVASSNGLASGNHPLEAISHAICEVVERDAITLWSVKDESEQQETRLDLDSVDDADCQDVIEKYKLAGVQLTVWEITSDICIPAFFCLATERSFSPLRPLPSALGYGCHPARSIALLRALTESAQSRLTYISGTRDDLGRNAYANSLNSDFSNAKRMQMETNKPVRKFKDVTSFDSSNLNEDVTWELDRLRSAGIHSAVLVDLTKPEFDLPVVRVVIPGLEPKDSIAEHIPGPRALEMLKRRK
jgi:ribosomal protein S12 methylthiotransferase accessory factor